VKFWGDQRLAPSSATIAAGGFLESPCGHGAWARSLVVADPEQAPKTMRLRYAGRCRSCAVALAKGDLAVYDPTDRKVLCLPCAGAVGRGSPAPDGQAVREPASGSRPDVAAALPALPDRSAQGSLVDGVAGASARREHQRRQAKREAAVRTAHPRIGGLILALTDEPQSTRAWQRGAVGEERLAQRLNQLTDKGVRLLHDRRIPGTRANIDHLAVTASGVYVIDAKRYTGRPHLRVDGGFLRPRTEMLMVGTRNCTKLLDGVLGQVQLVSTALASCPQAQDSPVRGMLCFIDADWPLIGGSFRIAQIDVLWPGKAAEKLTSPGALTPADIDLIHHHLAAAFPRA